MRSFLVFAVLCSLSMCEEVPCSPPIEGCICDTGVLKCSGDLCTKLPMTDIPAGTTEFIFDSCAFDSPVTSLPYTDAKVLAIINTRTPLIISDGAFEKMVNLNALELRNSNLAEIRLDMFRGLSTLKMISLAGNNIKEITDNAFQSTPMLRQLDLDDNNGIIIQKNAFTNLDHLTTLEVAKCGLTSLPAVPDSLITLNLIDNQFTSIPENAFSHLDNLQELHLGNCGLESVEGLDGLESLTFLDISYNKLTELDEDLLDDSKDTLTRLYLENNKFTKLPSDLVKWNQLLEIRIANNPWECSCDNAWLQVIHRNSKENVTCTSPAEFQGQDVHNVTSSLSCPDNNASTIVLAVIIPLLIICILLLIYYVYKMCQTRRRKGGKKNVRYSSVYKDTVETVSGKPPGRPMAEM